MKLHEAKRFLREALKAIYGEQEAMTIASIAIEEISGSSKSNCLLQMDLALSADQESKLQHITARLQKYEPLQYVLNKAWFYGMTLYVNEGVLIPRPETEELVEWIIKDVKASGLNVFDKKRTEADVTNQFKIIDVGTGSGCIALALKNNMPKAEVWGCDCSDKALTVARRNGSELDIRVDFQSVDFLDKAQRKHLPSVDIIVSNPPYIPLKDKSEMQPNVTQYEPHKALFVDDDDPLLFYKAIIDFAQHRLHQNGSIYVEIHEALGDDVKRLFEAAGYQAEIKKDMQGKERMVKAIHTKAFLGDRSVL